MQSLDEGNTNQPTQVISRRLVFRFQLSVTNKMLLLSLAGVPIEDFLVSTAVTASAIHLLVAASASVHDLFSSAEYLILFLAKYALHERGE